MEYVSADGNDVVYDLELVDAGDDFDEEDLEILADELSDDHLLISDYRWNYDEEDD